MKLASFRTPAGKATYGILANDRLYELETIFPQFPTLKDFIGSSEFVKQNIPLGTVSFPVEEITFLPVVPNPGKIVCVGLNYADHIKETGRSDSEYPSLFLRTNCSQTAHLAPLIKPSISDRFDYEGELAIVIGRPGRNIEPGQALTHIAGYSCYNDGSVRDWQRHTHQWTPGKNFDNTGSFGPWLATPEIIADRRETWLVTRLNGKEVQKACFAQMIFSIEELISYISKFTKLETGDVIVTGTPGGVGDRRTPPLYMSPGDQVEVEITGVGLLQNVVDDRVDDGIG
jgi:2-keto-4-pentenoate hydratase/2-oxohepta-3-ene-1,7-dioic acid hydratase in catechol pathway